MSALEVALLFAAVALVLALVAWASAWKTMEWLGDAEDLIERVQRADDRNIFSPVHDYKRRTPRRPT